MTEEQVHEQMLRDSRAAAAAAQDRQAPRETSGPLYDKTMAGWRITVDAEEAYAEAALFTVTARATHAHQQDFYKVETNVAQESLDARVRALANQLIETIRAL